ncbi:hypothetical protein NDU88_003218 [Pleurodeles waltl]|uniref:Uncharacterized protein n=1 Tax=Pleurodeles waltl TaxID=8319 RepID=A0AAV7M6G5_PLEWA|nr:hypothetical protein NDU88_003218 [Pleurodeles waltl]
MAPGPPAFRFAKKNNIYFELQLVNLSKGEPWAVGQGWRRRSPHGDSVGKSRASQSQCCEASTGCHTKYD